MRVDDKVNVSPDAACFALGDTHGVIVRVADTTIVEVLMDGSGKIRRLDTRLVTPA